MPAQITLEKTINPGFRTVLEAPSPLTHFGLLFEDDGNRGVLYAVDYWQPDNIVVNGVHIYDVDTRREATVVPPTRVHILWSSDGLKAGMLINDKPHAIIDFAHRRGYCRSKSPPLGPGWTHHGWSDDAQYLLR